ncbi:MAG: two-component system, NarL family, nitrate/nitrite response regulator NarL [Streptosporangiaceae bacterium]|jgi:two-component system nitrate/nitrite response regulator NarL|nr:two-component system, NarL family, nitrate/nitrite response regulator NarL [Streptosporangiaceae bacterium]
MRIVLGDGHRLFIDALAEALAQDGVTVAALATSPQEVLAAVARHRPDICLMAIRFHTCGNFGVLGLIRGRYPQVKVVLLADTADPAAASDAISNGAAGLIRKDQHLTEIIRTLTDVRAGERALDTYLPHPGPRDFRSPAPSDSEWLLQLLTLREQEVLMLIMEGQSTQQIARSLAISLSTARTHIQSVLVKLGAHSRLEATSMVARSCLLGISGAYTLGPPARQAAASG